MFDRMEKIIGGLNFLLYIINLRENVPGLVGGLIREWGLSF